MKINPKLDLVLERTLDVSPELVWEGWTTPEHLKHWFVPAPWTVDHVEIDLKPGGLFHTVMKSPEGEKFPNTGCYLEVIPNRKLVWTDALQAGFRPAPSNAQLGFHFTAVVLIEPQGAGTKYTAVAMHADEESRAKHDAMGFTQGWGTVAEQLARYMKTLKR